MQSASVIHLEDHRLSRAGKAAGERESSVAAAVAAPIPTLAADFGAAVPADAEADARRASWHYPPAVPIVDWFPPARTIKADVDTMFEALRLLAIAGAAAIVSGLFLATLAGAFALAVGN